MVLYREQKRRTPWLWVGVVAAFVVVLAVVVVVLSVASRPSNDARLADSLRLMNEQLDVLTISHYTPDVLSVGASSPEYGAAIEDMKRVKEEWAKIDGLVDPAVASTTSAQIDHLVALVDQMAPVDEVSASASELAESLRALEPHN